MADQPAVPVPSVHVKQRNIDGADNKAIGVQQGPGQAPSHRPSTVIVEQEGVRGDDNKVTGINTGTISAGKDTGRGSAKEKK